MFSAFLVCVDLFGEEEFAVQGLIISVNLLEPLLKILGFIAHFVKDVHKFDLGFLRPLLFRESFHQVFNKPFVNFQCSFKVRLFFLRFLGISFLVITICLANKLLFV